MISLTRLNNQPFVLNAELIRTIEQNPDTIITLVTGEHLIVRESAREIVARVIEYGRHLRGLIPPESPVQA
ncbi:MAG: flagellar protein [Planctomycetota bacterium]|nr:MAG: flagellar protein [Planctomycetota bacterium]